MKTILKSSFGSLLMCCIGGVVASCVFEFQVWGAAFAVLGVVSGAAYVAVDDGMGEV